MRIWVVESCRHCPECDELTPHSRRRVAPRLVLAAILVAAGAWGARHGGVALAIGALAWFVALILVAADRSRLWRIRCDRCRWKRLRKEAGGWPDPRSTEISC